MLSLAVAIGNLTSAARRSKESVNQADSHSPEQVRRQSWRARHLSRSDRRMSQKRAQDGITRIPKR